MGWIARDRLKRLAAAIDEPGASRNDRGLVVLPLFDLRAKAELVIGAQQRRPEMIDGALAGRSDQRQSAERLRRASGNSTDSIEPARYGHVSRARTIFLVPHEAPTRNPYGVARQRMVTLTEISQEPMRAAQSLQTARDRWPIGITQPRLKAGLAAAGQAAT